MRAVVAVCLLAVFAGCAGAGGSAAPAPTATPVADPATPERPSADAAPAGGSPTVGADAPANPWDADPVTVAVVAPADGRPYHLLVERALGFWENESTGYDLDYRIVTGPDRLGADVRVKFVANVTECDGARNGRDVGCADFVPRGADAPDPTRVSVETGYTNASTIETIKHEVGHTLGYDHGDTDAYEFMAAETRKVRLPTPNATERANPWGKDELLVYADYPDVIDSQRADYVEGVERAVEYYRTDEESTLPPGVRLGLTDDRSAADVVIEFPRTGTARSVGRRYGYDEDADDAFERFTRYEITVYNIDRDRVGWHVGYWLGWAFGAESSEDLPPPFDEPDEDDREEW